jgi:hypothetical protein
MLAEAAALEDRLREGIQHRHVRGWVSLPDPTRASSRIRPCSKSVRFRFTRILLETQLGDAHVLDLLAAGDAARAAEIRVVKHLDRPRGRGFHRGAARVLEQSGSSCSAFSGFSLVVSTR